MLELAFPIAVGILIDRLLPGENWGRILLASIGVLLVYMLNTGLIVVVNYWGHVLGISIETELAAAASTISRSSPSVLRRPEDRTPRRPRDQGFEEIGEVAHHGPEDAFIAVMTFIGAFLLMFTVNVQLALITTLIVPITVCDHPLRWPDDPEPGARSSAGLASSTRGSRRT